MTNRATRLGGSTLLGRLALAAGLLVLIGAVVVWVAHQQPTGNTDADSEIPALQVPPAAIQLGAVGQPELAGAGPLPVDVESLAGWAHDLAAGTDIPARALEAYGLAELVERRSDPGCHLSWVTVAGLARIESNHGRFHGSQVRADGEVAPPISGVPLDGTNGNAIINDGGGYAQAHGPLQFIPSTWARWGTDTHGQGRADVDNIDDAAVTAGRYLCASNRDLATGPGWTQGVLSYNHSEDYARRVYTAAAAYAAGRTP